MSDSAGREGDAGSASPRPTSGKRRLTDSPARSGLGAGADTSDAPEFPATSVDLHVDSTAIGEVGAALPRGVADRILPQASSRIDGHEICQPQHDASVPVPSDAFSVDELKERANKMFTGVSGGPRASHDSRAMAEVTVALLIAVMQGRR